MKKLDISKRLLPLMDIMFILLGFFIVLPHGVRSAEKEQIKYLKEKNHDIKNELEIYRWKNGEVSGISLDEKFLTIYLLNNKVYYEKYPVEESYLLLKYSSNVELSEKTLSDVETKISDIVKRKKITIVNIKNIDPKSSEHRTDAKLSDNIEKIFKEKLKIRCFGGVE